MYFSIKKMLKKCNEIWEKVSNIIKIEYNSQPVRKKKYLIKNIKKINGKEGFQCSIFFRLENSIFQNITNFFRVGFFLEKI